MKIFNIVAGLVLLLGIVLVFVAPVGPLPGFFIGGQSTPVPERWMDTSKTHEIQLRVPGTLPRVVIIWVVEYQQALYVVGSAESGWVSRLGQGGPVEMNLEGKLYALNAQKITEGLEPVLAAYVAKYQPDYPQIVDDFPSIEDGRTQFGVFRLDPS